MGLIVRRVESHLYTPDQILDFIKDIEVDLQAVHDALKAGGDPSKRHTFCLFVSNFGGTMSVPTDPPYCLVYPTSYMRDVELDHFDTHNNLAGMCLHHCVCCATLQFNNDKPKECTNYSGSCLILPHGAQYNDQLFPMILEPWNHQGPLIDSTMKEPYLMELVGDFRVADLIFKGCYGDLLLYSDAGLCQLRWWGIHLPVFQGEIPMPPAPSYRQAREPEVTKQSPHRAVASDTPTESPKAVPNVAWDAAPTPQLQSTKTLLQSRNPPKAHSSHKHSCSPSPATRSVRCKWRDFHMEDSGTDDTTLPISSSMFDDFHSPMGSYSDVTEPLPHSITSTPLGQASPRHWRTTSADSRHSKALHYTSPNFNLPGYPAVRLGSLTPSMPSIARSHHMLSTWPPSLFTSGHRLCG